MRLPLGMNSYYSFQERDSLRGRGYLFISVAWLMGAFALWFYANQETLFRNYLIAMIIFLVLAKLFGFLGWKEYARSKGYKWAFGFFSFLPALGPAFLVFLDDKWQDQQIPKLNIEKFEW